MEGCLFPQEAQGAIVKLSSDGKDVETPLEADRLPSKAACLYNLALHLPADKLPSLSWGLQRLRNELKDVLQARCALLCGSLCDVALTPHLRSCRLHQIRLLQYIHTPLSTLRHTRSLPDLGKTPAELPDHSNETIAALLALVETPEPSPELSPAPQTATSEPKTAPSCGPNEGFACTIPGCNKSFGYVGSFCPFDNSSLMICVLRRIGNRDRHVAKVKHDVEGGSSST